MKAQYQDYYDAFIAEGEKKVRAGVGIILQFYPYTGGTLIFVELRKGEDNKAMQKKTQDSLDKALYHTQLFDVDVCARFKGRTVNKTLYYIISGSKYLIFKNESENEWSVQTASNDFLEIVKKAKEKYGKKN